MTNLLFNTYIIVKPTISFYTQQTYIHMHTLLELQLAALLGKSLLKKNSELEQSLRRLQEYAEETMSTNQVN